MLTHPSNDDLASLRLKLEAKERENDKLSKEVMCLMVDVSNFQDRCSDLQKQLDSLNAFRLHWEPRLDVSIETSRNTAKIAERAAVEKWLLKSQHDEVSVHYQMLMAAAEMCLELMKRREITLRTSGSFAKDSGKIKEVQKQRETEAQKAEEKRERAAKKADPIYAATQKAMKTLGKLPGLTPDKIKEMLASSNQNSQQS